MLNDLMIEYIYLVMKEPFQVLGQALSQGFLRI